MADTKISDLTAITGANTATGDLFTVVDVSDTTMAASGTNKSITRAELLNALATAFAQTLLDDADQATAQTTLGLGTGNSPQFTGVNIGHASDTTITRSGAGDIAVEGNVVYRAGGTDVPVTDGGTGASTAAGARTNLGVDTVVVSLQVTDPNGAVLATGDGQAYFRVPSLLNGALLTGVAAHVTTVSSSGTPTVQIHNVTDAADMLSTRITIDANEKDSSTAAAAAVIDTAADDVATADELRIDVDVAGTGTKGLIVELTFTR